MLSLLICSMVPMKMASNNMSILQTISGGPAKFAFLHDDVHVWCAPLGQPSHVVEQLFNTLSSDEKERAKRYKFEYLQRAFTVARGMLRLLLARYLALQPEELEFVYMREGKPQLSEKHNRKVFFNLSHSNELVIYAFSSVRKVGIDIEYIRPVDDLDMIAVHNFSVREITDLKTLPPQKILKGFFNCWTRKEAYIKAIGDGLSFPLQEFDVSLNPGEPAKLLSVCGSVEEARYWSMTELHPRKGYAAALVVEGVPGNIVYREWNGLDLFIDARS
jgi:4'-phosphopantetheinyl transferase